MPDKAAFRPFYDEDQDYTLAPATTGNMRALDMLRMQATITPEKYRRQIAEEYCLEYDYAEEDEAPTGAGGYVFASIPKGEFYQEAAEVLFLGAGDTQGRDDVDVGEVRRAMGKFENAGTEEMTALSDGLQNLTSFLNSANRETTI